MSPVSMRAWRAHQSGEPADVLQVDTITVPEPSDDQALIAVDGCGLNFPDVLQCRGLYHDLAPRPFTPGMEVVGTVVRAPGLPVGTRVIAMPTLPFGGLAEYCVAPLRDVFTVPDDMPVEHAAGFLIVYQTAWLALHRRAAIRPGETVLVHGAAGGVGTAALQLARAAGARVVAAVRGARKRTLIEATGVDLAIDVTTTDFVGAILEFTDGHGADVIIDPIGGETFARSRKCIAWEGRLVVLGFMANAIADAPTNQVLLKNFSVVGLNTGAYRQRAPHAMRQAHHELLDLYSRGAINPQLHRLDDHSDARAALSELAEGKVVGKAVVTPFGK